MKKYGILTLRHSEDEQNKSKKTFLLVKLKISSSEEKVFSYFLRNYNIEGCFMPTSNYTAKRGENQNVNYK